MSKTLSMTLLILALLIAPSLAPATTFLNSKSPGLDIDTVYDDDVFISGAKIKFDSRVYGDLFSFSYEMVQTDTIDGNFMGFGYSVQSLAPVTGSLRIFAANASCNSQIGRNLLLFCQNTNIGPEASVGRDADLMGQNVLFQGDVARNLKIKAQTATISGTINGDLSFKGDSLVINSNTTVGGNLNYESATRATISEGAKIGGQINWKRTELEKKAHEEKKSGLALLLSWTISLRGYVIYSMVLFAIVLVATIVPAPSWLAMLFLWIVIGVCGNLVILLSKKQASSTELTLRSRLFPSLGLGFILLILVPVVVGIIFFTLIGAPLAILLMMLFGIALFVGGIYVCLFTGRRICGIFNSRSADTPGYLCFTIGMIILVALSFIPILGYIITLIIMMLGLGGLTLTYWAERTKARQSTPAQS